MNKAAPTPTHRALSAGGMPVPRHTPSLAHTAPRASDRLLKSLSLFGLTLDDVDDGRREHARRLRSASVTADMIMPRLTPGVIVMITGPSGSGKSTLLRSLAARARRGHWRIRSADEREACGAACVAEALTGPLLGERGALRALAAAGLADATLLGRSPKHLSDGQQFRLGLAKAFLRCVQRGDHRPTLLVADEFAVSLDRLSAKCLAGAVRRWVDKSVLHGSSGEGTTGGAVVMATPHDDLLEFLRPNVLVVVNDDSEFRIM